MPSGDVPIGIVGKRRVIGDGRQGVRLRRKASQSSGKEPRSGAATAAMM